MSVIRKTAKIFLEDQSLRDGLQMETRHLGLDEKIRLFRMLEKAGFRRIQVGAFVHPKIVPQMADTDQLIKGLVNDTDVTVSALVLNARGLERALTCGVPDVNISASISDAHSRKNTGMAAAGAVDLLCRLVAEAMTAGLAVKAGLQCVFGCVYEGAQSPQKVLEIVGKLAQTGVREINLADTTGMATPLAVRGMVTVLCKTFPQITFSLHLHDTRGLGLANLFSGYEAGIRAFDVCAGGLGGCPFVEKAAGNVAAEDVVNMFEEMGIRTGVDLAELCDVVGFLENRLERPLPGHMRRLMPDKNSPSAVR